MQTVVGALGRVQRILCWLVLENRGQRTGAGEETLSPETQSVTYPAVPLRPLFLRAAVITLFTCETSPPSSQDASCTYLRERVVSVGDI